MTTARVLSNTTGILLFFVAAGSAWAAGEKPTTKKPDPSGLEVPYLSGVTQLTSRKMGLFKAGEAYFSPDGQTIIFQAFPLTKKEYQIYTMDLKTRRLRMVSTGRGACTCAYFRPDGEKILFASSHLDPALDQATPEEHSSDYRWNFNPHMDLFEADPDGSHLRRLTDTPGYDAECSYSPDGKSIVFTSQRDGDLEIYVMDTNGANPRRITFAKGYDGGPFFSPDGQRILYRGDHRGDGKMNLQLHIVTVDGRHDRALTDNRIFNWCPFWYPTGRCLIFTQADHEAYARGSKPNYDLYMTTPQGKAFTRITFASEFDGLPAFNANGTKLLWTSKRGGLETSQIFIADFKLPDQYK